MALGSYETVNFSNLVSPININFQKVITDSSVNGKPLIDWKDSLKTNDYILSCISSSVKFISRPLVD